MNFVFRKDSGKSPKNSLKVAFCACKLKFGSTTVHCSNSVMHELWTLNCAWNERREAYLSIHVHLIKQIYDYDSKKLKWNSVSFILDALYYIPCVPEKRKPVLSARYFHCRPGFHQTIWFIFKGIFPSFIWYQTHDDISMHDWKEQFELMHVKIELRRIMVLSWYDQVQTS